MSPPELRVRRATTDDIVLLRTLWETARLPADELEKRLTEFQLVEAPDGWLLGAIALEIHGQHARVHSEAYTDAAMADPARELFWERIRRLASNHGVFRLWTQEASPFWTRTGFRFAVVETLARLPDKWKGFEGKWYTAQLKSEEALATVEKELAVFRETERNRNAQTLGKARTVFTAITVLFFVAAVALVGIAIYLLIYRRLPWQ